MKKLILILSIITLASCKSEEEKLVEQHDKLMDEYFFLSAKADECDSIAEVHTNPDSIRFYEVMSNGYSTQSLYKIQLANKTSDKIEKVRYNLD